MNITVGSQYTANSNGKTLSFQEVQKSEKIQDVSTAAQNIGSAWQFERNPNWPSKNYLRNGYSNEGG